MTELLCAHDDSVTCVAMGTITRLLASGSGDRTIMLHELVDRGRVRKSHILKGHTGAVNSLALSPDDRYLASAGSDAYVRIWCVASGQQARVLDGHTDYVYGVVWSRDGKTIVSGSQDSTLCVWKADEQVCVVVLLVCVCVCVDGFVCMYSFMYVHVCLFIW